MCDVYQKLPTGWYSPRLAELGNIFTGTTPPTSDQSNYGGDLPFVGPSDLGGKRWVESCSDKLTKKGELLSRAAEKNAVFVSCIGILGKAGQTKEKTAFNQQINAIQPDEKKIDPSFIYYACTRLKPKLNTLAGLQVVPIVNKSLFSSLEILAPKKLSEQRLIARILDTLDTHIQKAEALIAKLEKVKEGLLHDLLTRGIDENGKLRPGPEQAPELYKESPLGLIPREWQARPLSTAVKEVIPGAAIKSGEFSDTGKPVIAKSDVTGSKLIDIVNREQFVSLQAASLYSRSMVDEGAVVVSLRDLVPSGPTVGMGSIFYGKGVYILAQGTYGLYLKEELMTREFFSEITRRSWFRSQARGITVGSTQVHARSSEYVRIIIPIPALHEQIAINERIRSLDENISAEKRALSEASDLKKGLMDDLLTGRVRVTPLLEQAQATTPA
ncbi:restriction endonuclease subunit S [Halomonas sp. FeN2]|uniref:restriction endonuclease subunit S n=1 Tax=Halomonas sp. FeN2 TaxID=2832500 RepID=UPI000C494E9E|nr:MULTISPECIES: restriction endonuclease subunit S [unclassified Halomonas]MBF58270.1 hypothetical protein [Halomonas sp.]UBR50894.1 restriction endonuclease subunit S [Halomonas sp. FeN2]|tara:strand:- start:18283 stop:19611 length:1329 start_codon:yes stop_codon:yes gene_type:complete